MNKNIYVSNSLFKDNNINEFITRNIEIARTLEIGEYQKNFFNEDLFVIPQNVELKYSKDLVYESHKEYYDIHLIIDNFEVINLINKKDLNIQAFELNDEHDYYLYKTNSFDKEIILSRNEFIVCKFDDIHKVGIKTKHKENSVKKIVIKIKKDYFEKEFINE